MARVISVSLDLVPVDAGSRLQPGDAGELMLALPRIHHALSSLASKLCLLWHVLALLMNA